MLTVCINNLNDGKYLPRVVGSIRAQETECPYEIVGIDAGSTDDSLEQYARLDVPVVDCTGLNQAASVNKVIGQTESEFFCWINPDDSYLPNFVESHIAAFRDNPEVGIVHSPYELVNENGVSRIIRPPRPVEEAFLEAKNYICHPTTMIRRTVFDRIGTFDETVRWPFDMEFWLRTWRAGIPLFGLSEPTARYVSRPDNATAKHRDEIIEEVCRLADRYQLDKSYWMGQLRR